MIEPTTENLQTLIALADKGQKQAYNMSHDCQLLPCNNFWSLHETMSLLHYYAAVEIDYDNMLDIGKGLYEMLVEENLEIFMELQTELAKFVL
jgi:hypothetical protein